VQQFISSYGYLAVFILMLAESACIPVPSELTMLFAGAHGEHGRRAERAGQHR
jgi:membrane protein DedA with SNARE-associated domain